MLIRAEPADFRASGIWLEEISVKYGVPTKKAIGLEQCLDEVLMNILMHGGPSAKEKPIEIQFQTVEKDGGSEASIVVADGGVPFNPVKGPQKEMPKSLEEAMPGGLGLTLIHSISTRLDYEYKNGCNVLTIGLNY